MDDQFKAPKLPACGSTSVPTAVGDTNSEGDASLMSDDEQKESATEKSSADDVKPLPLLPYKDMDDQFKAPKRPACDSTSAPTAVGDTNSEGDASLMSDDEQKESATEKSPADDVKPLPPLPYKEPSWSGTCSQAYTLEIIKNGVAVNDLKLSSKAYWVVGRLPQCDISMEHPSLSRYHAIIQYCGLPSTEPNRQIGWYLYDLSSTHGTTLNKQKISALTYHRLRVGYTFKFGGSSRLHILQGPEDDQELEISKDEVSALREKRKAQLLEKERLRAEARMSEVADSRVMEDGCGWGIDEEDAADADVDAVNPFSSDVMTEELTFDDPKKSLRGWYEREGYEEPEYILEEQSHGRYKCTVELPVDTATGHPLKAEVSVQGKKKEAVVQCALEACRILDKQGVLRQARHESRKRKVKNWDADDYYDSDDDAFLDRTGDIERKRQIRMKRAGKLEADKKQAALTYDQLVEQLAQTEIEMADIQAKLDATKKLEKEKEEGMDDLDAYMLSIRSGGMNATEKTKCKRRMIELRNDKNRTEKLINIARPNSLQELRVVRPAADKSSIVQLTADENKTNELTVIRTSSNISSSPKPTKNIKREIPSQTSGPEMLSLNPLPDVRQVSNSDQASATSNSSDCLGSESIVGTGSQARTTTNTTKEPPCEMDQSDMTSASRAPAKTSRLVKLSKQTPTATRSSLAEMVTDLKTKAEDEELMKDADYASWLPPSNQVGDGRTSLNDKYGY